MMTLDIMLVVEVKGSFVSQVEGVPYAIIPSTVAESANWTPRAPSTQLIAIVYDVVWCVVDLDPIIDFGL